MKRTSTTTSKKLSMMPTNRALMLMIKPSWVKRNARKISSTLLSRESSRRSLRDKPEERLAKDAESSRSLIN